MGPSCQLFRVVPREMSPCVGDACLRVLASGVPAGMMPLYFLKALNFAVVHGQALTED